MIDLVRRLLARARTVNEINQVHIALGNRITPCELHALREAMGPQSAVWNAPLVTTLSRRRGTLAQALRRLRPATALPAETHAWADELAGMAAKSGRAAPEPFRRRRVRPHVVGYSDGGPPGAKTLVLCFTGKSRRLFMPMPVFLQHLPAGRFDLHVLCDPSRNGYRRGLAGVAGGFSGLVDEIGRTLDRGAYRSVVAFGSSGGGIPALVTALRLGLDRGISVGGRSPVDRRWEAACTGGARALIADAARRAAAPVPLLLVHGADSAPDAAAVGDVTDLVPATTVAVCGEPGEEVGHNALLPLLRQSRLAAFLAAALDGDAPPLGAAGGGPAPRVLDDDRIEV